MGNGVRFVETISPEALNDADMEDVRALIDHNPSLILARTTADTLQLEVDEVGLRFRAELADTTYARDLYKNIQAGNINQCSFAFELDEKGDTVRYNKESKMYERTLNSFKRIKDVSAVTYPAYEDTDVAPAIRSIEQAEQEAKDLLEKQKRKLQLELDLMKLKGDK
jgi:HK97 family phage prohead protease